MPARMSGKMDGHRKTFRLTTMEIIASVTDQRKCVLLVYELRTRNLDFIAPTSKLFGTHKNTQITIAKSSLLTIQGNTFPGSHLVSAWL